MPEYPETTSPERRFFSAEDVAPRFTEQVRGFLPKPLIMLDECTEAK